MNRASNKEFDIARRYFPFSCVDLVVVVKKGVVLIKRREAPYKGLWHLPGGIVHKGETFLQKIDEVALREIGCKIVITAFVGVYQNIHPYRHDISHCYIAKLRNESVDVLNRNTKVFEHIP